VTDMYASVKTRVMELKDFQRITLAPGESKEVSFTLTPYQLSLLNDHMDRVVEPGQFRIMIGGKSPSYTAADRIKNSVGYRSAAEGVNDSLDYTAAHKADFFLTPGPVEEDTVHHQKRVGVTVTNKGNLTDVGTVTMYVDGVQQEEVHHFELGAGQAKQIWFVPEGKGTVDCIFITKYRSATGRYTL
jgi:beta-glucosidase